MTDGRTLIILTMILSAGLTPIAIRITQSEGVPSLVIVLIRLWLASLAMLPLIWTRYRSDLLRLTPWQWLLSGIAGFWLALNLFLLFVSLEYTSVLMTSLLRRTSPMWIVLPEILIFGVMFSRRFWLSLVLTLVGVAMVGFGGLTAIEAGSDPLLGGALALVGSFCFGAYLLIGRRLNNVIPPLLYSFVVFVSAALVTSIFVAGTGTPVTGYTEEAYIWTVIVAILAQFFWAYQHESGAAILHGDRHCDRAAGCRGGERRDRAVSLRRDSVADTDRRRRPGDLRRRRHDDRADAGALETPAADLVIRRIFHLSSTNKMR